MQESAVNMTINSTFFLHFYTIIKTRKIESSYGAWYNGGRAVIIAVPVRSERRGIRALADRECQEEVAE